MPDLLAPDGTRLHYDDEGEGLPLLALPGLTRTGRDFDHVAPHLGDVRLIRLDARGRGRSDWADPATYTAMHEARDVLALLDHLALPRAAILGTSRGGIVGMLLAHIAKERLLGVALNDVGAVVDPAGLRFIRTYLGRKPPYATLEEAALARAAWPAFPGVPMDRWRAEVANQYHQTRDGLALTYDPRLADGFTDDPPSLWLMFESLDDLPLAILRGQHSDILSRATYDEMIRLRPDAHAAEVPDRGHVPFLDEPASLAVLRPWLDACRAFWTGDAPPG